MEDQVIYGSVQRNDPGELIPTERIALVAAALALGGTVTTTFLAAELGITRSGAWRLLTKVSRVLPITSDDDERWYWVDSQSTGLR
jgi:hypothetical protein